MKNTVRIHADDNVIIALESMEKGDCAEDAIAGKIVATTAIPLYHKIAVTDLKKGQPVIKYGTPIGVATANIPKGAHIHVHNVDSADGMRDDVVGGTN